MLGNMFGGDVDQGGGVGAPGRGRVLEALEADD